MHTLARVQFPGGFIEWGWTDWLGLVAVLIGIAFLYAVVKAIRSGTPGLQVLKETNRALATIFRRGPR